MTKTSAFPIDHSRTMISALIHGRKITPMDVAWLRREVFADGRVSRAAAQELFAVARAAIPKCAEWTAFFVEMIAEHSVWQLRPSGVVSETQAEWLIFEADACANVDALAAIVNVLAEAHNAPQWFLAAVRARAAMGWPGVAAALAGASAY